jgi:hypothetical protein
MDTVMTSASIPAARLAGVLVLIGALLMGAAPASTAGWTIIEEIDTDHLPDWDCGSNMSENDMWWSIQDGSLAPGETLTLQHPRPTCWHFPARLAWRYLGKGRPPTSITLTITSPNGEVSTFRDTPIYAPEPGIPPGIGTLFDIREYKQRVPTWARACVEEQQRSEYLGTWTFQITNTGTTTAASLRIGAYMHIHEFDFMGCVTTDPTYVATGYWWPNELQRVGL